MGNQTLLGSSTGVQFSASRRAESRFGENVEFALSEPTWESGGEFFRRSESRRTQGALVRIGDTSFRSLARLNLNRAFGVNLVRGSGSIDFLDASAYRQAGLSQGYQLAPSTFLDRLRARGFRTQSILKEAAGPPNAWAVLKKLTGSV